MKAKWIALVLLAMGLAACGKQTDGTAVGPGQSGDTPAPAAGTNCASAWSQYVAAHPQGRQEEFQSVTQMTSAGIEIPRRVTRDSMRVVESNAERVTTETTTEGHSASLTMTKTQFLESCKMGAPADMPTDATAEVLERKNLSVTVRAGTFNTSYTKVRVKVRQGTTITESWVDAQGTHVKTKMTTETTEDGQSMKMVMERELVRRQG